MSTRISRRTVATGAAWSVPVLAVSAAAPAMAASVPCPTVTLVGYSRSGPSNAPTWTITVTIGGLTVGVAYSVVLQVTDSKGSSTTETYNFVASATTQEHVFTATRHDNGANATITGLTYQVLVPTTCTGILIP
jgi:hypothetical protein